MTTMLQGASLPISGNGGTVTVSTPLIDGTQTWNNGATTFTGIKLNVTDTASASSSMLLQLQTGGVDQFRVFKDGTIFASKDIKALSNSSVFTLGVGQDVILTRDAANTLALRNGTNAQTFNVYNTYTDASNYENFHVSWIANAAFVGTGKAGTGISRSMVFETGDTSRFQITNNGDFLASTDNTYDIGASGANRPRNVYAAGNIVPGTTGALQWPARLDVTSPAGGNMLVRDSTGTTFGLLQFGGTTSSFPAIKRNGATFDFRLADDSAYAAITSGRVFATNGINMTDGTDLFWNSRSSFASPSDGVITLTNNAKTAFTGLLLGPSGTSYVRLKPSGVGGMLSLRLADDSADAPLTVSYVKTQAVAVSALPAAATAGAGARSFVTDALAPTFGAAVTGGGAVSIPVYSDGTTWKVG